jgi:hypothetical protein
MCAAFDHSIGEVNGSADCSRCDCVLVDGSSAQQDNTLADMMRSELIDILSGSHYLVTPI